MLIQLAHYRKQSRGATFVISGVVRSTGAVIPPLLILAVALWGIRVPLAHLLLPRYGTDAIWWSFAISSVCSMAMAFAFYRWGSWRRARMLRTDPHEIATPTQVPATPPSPVADRDVDANDESVASPGLALDGVPGQQSPR